MLLTNLVVSTSQIRIVLSQLPTAKLDPSGDQLTLNTQSWLDFMASIQAIYPPRDSKHDAVLIDVSQLTSTLHHIRNQLENYQLEDARKTLITIQDCITIDEKRVPKAFIAAINNYDRENSLKIANDILNELESMLLSEND